MDCSVQGSFWGFVSRDDAFGWARVGAGRFWWWMGEVHLTKRYTIDSSPHPPGTTSSSWSPRSRTCITQHKTISTHKLQTTKSESTPHNRIDPPGRSFLFVLTTICHIPPSTSTISPINPKTNKPHHTHPIPPNPGNKMVPPPPSPPHPPQPTPPHQLTPPSLQRKSPPTPRQPTSVSKTPAPPSSSSHPPSRPSPLSSTNSSTPYGSGTLMDYLRCPPPAVTTTQQKHCCPSQQQRMKSN